MAKRQALKMSDKELVRRLFPKAVRKALKAAFLETERKKPGAVRKRNKKR